jgi:2-polyprenyl-6-methoxyphenol hydroxylase-like FAD-dependent oxidoreductase
MPGSAVVVGGGIGGLSAAVGLERAGWRITLLERAEAFRPVGAGLGIAPNGVRALDWLGLGDRVRGYGLAQGAAGIRAASGRWLLREDVDEIRRRFGEAGYLLHRADVHAMLTETLHDTDVRTGHQATEVDARTGTVTFRDPAGREGNVAGDLVVAADGADSTLRVRLFPDHPGLRYAGYLAWRGVVPAEAAAGLELGSGPTESWGRGRRFGVVPLRDGRVYWYAALSAPPGSHTEDDIRAVADRFRDWHEPIPALLAATPAEALLRHDIQWLRTPLPRYVLGRAVLLGDAAHAMTPDLGQGACLALEDAVTLAGLAARPADLGTVTEDYDRARRVRTQRATRMSALTGRVTQWRNPMAVRLRDGLARRVPAWVYLRSLADLFSWTPDPAWSLPDRA